MLIQLQPQHLAKSELELEFLAVESGIVFVDDAMVVGADDNDVCGVVVLRTGEVVERALRIDVGNMLPDTSFAGTDAAHLL